MYYTTKRHCSFSLYAYELFHFKLQIATFFTLYFHFCFELALEMWAKASLTHSLGVCDFNHTHSFCKLSIYSGLLDQQTLLLTYSFWNGDLTRGKVSTPNCAASADQGFSTAAKAAAMCTMPHAETCPPSPISPFLLAQNLTDNLCPPKSDKRHLNYMCM